MFLLLRSDSFSSLAHLLTALFDFLLFFKLFVYAGLLILCQKSGKDFLPFCRTALHILSCLPCWAEAFEFDAAHLLTLGTTSWAPGVLSRKVPHAGVLALGVLVGAAQFLL